MRRGPSAGLAAVTLTLLLAACGGSSSTTTTTTSDEAQVRATITTYVQALADADAPKVCGMLTEQAQKAASTTGHSCAANLAAAFKALGGKAKVSAIAKQFKIAKITVTGDTATVTGTASDQKSVPLQKVGGVWKLQSASS